MCSSNELFNLGLIFLEIRVDIGGVDDTGTLGLRQDEVEEEEESDVLVKRYPEQNSWLEGVFLALQYAYRGQSVPDKEPIGPALNEQSASQHHPVHQPWCQLSGIGGLEGFVGGEKRE